MGVGWVCGYGNRMYPGTKTCLSYLLKLVVVVMVMVVLLCMQ